jgi:hypothetical protein
VVKVTRSRAVPVLMLLRGDHELNAIKAQKIDGIMHH